MTVSHLHHGNDSFSAVQGFHAVHYKSVSKVHLLLQQYRTPPKNSKKTKEIQVVFRREKTQLASGFVGMD